MIARFVDHAQRHPWRWLLAYLIVTAALYQLAVRVPLYAPFVVHPSALDRAIPLLPWSAGPYLTYFLLMPSFVFLALPHPRRGALLVAAALVVFGNLAINNLVPTELAEPLTPAFADSIDASLLALIVSSDTPRAALPSGHLALPLALAILSLRARLRWRWLYPPWTLVMGIAILTTRQHYVADAIGGLAWGTLGSLIAWRLVGLHRIHGR